MTREPHTPAAAPPSRPTTLTPGELVDARSSDALQLIAEGVTDLAGFGVAAISVVRGDSLEVVAVSGDDEARQKLPGRRTPVNHLMTEVDKADEWGLLRFVPHERLDPSASTWGWVPDIVVIDDPDAWHPLDLLIAPLYDESGSLRGTLAIDLPVNGKRPDEAQRRVLQTYAEQAGRAVLTTLEREALAEKVRLAEAARQIVRNASSQLRLERILADCQDVMIEGFGAHGMWIQTFDEDGLGTGTIYSGDGSQIRLPPELVSVAERAAKRAWELQTSEVVAAGHAFGPTISTDEGGQILAFLDAIGIHSLLFAPLGAGPECLGNLVLTRLRGAPDWTHHEAAAALDIGHDLGRAILNARAFERELRLVEELQALDTYKSQLIATVSHELKNPLTAITGHLEILESSPDVTDRMRGSLRAMNRGSRRLARVIEDLLLLSKVGDPNYPIIPVPVDLHRTLEEVLDLSSIGAQRKGLTILVEAPDEPVLAHGDPDELDRVCANLVSNAIKYTPAGRQITIRLSEVGDEVVLAVSDQGLGISAADQEHLFSEFFRSTNPVAVAEPGTGLGLAIVKRIVERHGGSITVHSVLGEGSTFTVAVPVARPDDVEPGSDPAEA